MTVGNNTLYFSYDASGTPHSVLYGNNYYYYVTNLQGDVVGILDASGNKVATYTYDAWGNVLTETATGIGLYNPLRYRGYVYDRETKLYYLQSRYYDPEVGRFINPDNYPSTGQGLLGNNMFAYCNNNPVNYNDQSGKFGTAALFTIGAVVGGTIDYARQVIQNRNRGKTGAELWLEVDWGSVFGTAFSGGVSAIPGGGALAEVVDAVGSNVIEHAVNAVTQKSKFDIKAVGSDIVSDVVTSPITSKLTPSIEIPHYIRDIKQAAKSMGIKGTHKLQNYLNFKQVGSILINALNSSTTATITDFLQIG